MPGPLMMDIEGITINEREIKLLQHPLVGGVTLFTRNYQSIHQLIDLVKMIRHCLPDGIIAVDHEGGSVQRFKNEFTQLPAVSHLGKIHQEDPHTAKEYAHLLGWLMAVELLACDIDISFAPVLDLGKGISDVIKDRAFAQDKDSIIALSQAYVDGMHTAGMAATGKHFPGHGSVKADSHVALPIDDRTFQAIKNDDLVPFQTLVNHGIDGIMPAHIVYQQVDTKPACFSHYWLQTILRHELNFQGAIFSDDLNMVGAHAIGPPSQRAEQALAAGCDMVLLLNDPNSIGNVLEHLENCAFKPSVDSLQRLNNMRAEKSIQWVDLVENSKYQKAVEIARSIN